MAYQATLFRRLYTDKKGRLWLATAAGISMLDITNQQWKMRFLDYNNTDELSINKIERDKYDSTKVWMSCFKQGMLCVNWKTKQIEKTYSIGADATRVLGFAQLSKTRWLLVTQKKIIEWDINTGVALSKRLPVADSLGLTYSIRGIIMPIGNTVFILSDKGLFRYDLPSHRLSPVPKAVMPEKTKDRLKYDLINGFFENGSVWAASRNGLFSL